MAGRYRGVTQRGQGWQISFTLPDGTRCRESVRFPHTRKGEEQAYELRASALAAIDRGTFDYPEFFPRSRSAIRYSRFPGRHITIRDSLECFLVRKKSHLSLSTYKDYSSRIYAHLLPIFGDFPLCELTADHVRSWYNSTDLSAKAINNILIPLRDVFAEAYQSEKIDRNPLDRIKALPVVRSEPDPFSRSEVKKLLGEIGRRSASAKIYFQFAFGTGLRTSELLALTWDDIDMGKNTVFANKAKVRGVLKEPKTTNGRRKVDLQPDARRATSSLRNEKNKSDVLFSDCRTGEPWKGDQSLRKGFWYPALDALQMRRRTAYHTRHTFASQLLSDGMNPMYVAQQMGHRDWGMIRLVYGRYIKADDRCTRST
ncbi:MAG: site-specific integrase [Gammaproteobacteria bacterium]|nr:site-specific integrase [Gammaproteobacteria bacterium]